MEVYKETKVPEPENIAEYVAQLRYTPDEREGFSKIIREFNELYYSMSKQTWGNTKWRGVPVFKTPTDMWIYQELIQAIEPELIIETGTCFGGSTLYMRDLCNLIYSDAWIISIDTTHEHLREEAKVQGIDYVLGSSISEEIIEKVREFVSRFTPQRIMVILDSDHSKEHVLKELELYAPLVTSGSILIVEDTNTDGPFQAIKEWLPSHTKEFSQNYMCEKFMLTFNREGYLERL